MKAIFARPKAFEIYIRRNYTIDDRSILIPHPWSPDRSFPPRDLRHCLNTRISRHVYKDPRDKLRMAAAAPCLLHWCKVTAACACVAYTHVEYPQWKKRHGNRVTNIKRINYWNLQVVKRLMSQVLSKAANKYMDLEFRAFHLIVISTLLLLGFALKNVMTIWFFIVLQKIVSTY